MEQKFKVGGMSCAACSARVERAVSSLPSVEVCTVNLLTGDMIVSGDASVEDVIDAVTRAGYTAENAAENSKKHGKGDEFSERSAESRGILIRFLSSLLPMFILMYLSMGHMLGAPIPAFLSPFAVAIIQLVLALIIMVINYKFFVNGFMGVMHLAPNMDTLVSLGSAASFVYSVYIVVRMSPSGGMEHLHSLYFETAAMILVFISLGKYLESVAKGKTTSALAALLRLAPKRATLLIGGVEQTIDIEDLKVGDTFVVRAGESIPTDAKIISGAGAIDESALTGESMPYDKSVGEDVYAATILKSGYIVCRATRVGEGTTLSEIIRMVKEASATKAPIAKLADRVAGIFVPIVLGISLLTLGGWFLFGETFGFALARAVAVLVISCPCALGLATPVAIMVGSGSGAKHGILYKNATALEVAGRVKTVIFDKTGTLTNGTPVVTDVLPINYDGEEFISLIYSLENMSEHPLGEAVAGYAKERGAKLLPVQGYETLPGRGVSGKLDGKTVFATSLAAAKELTFVDKSIEEKCLRFAAVGKTPLVFTVDGVCAGIVAVADTAKADAAVAVSELSSMGIDVIMLTGDNEVTANAVAREIGISHVIAGVLPSGKESAVREVMANSGSKVAMVGDGINDAPALTSADLGIAVGAGTDVAIDSADVVLMNSSPRDVVNVISLGRKTLANIRENLTWAFLYNMIGIPMAIGLFGLTLDPMFGALAMSLSSFSVVMNALRLGLWKPRAIKKETHTVANAAGEEEVKNMKITLNVSGMMCPHCESRVKKALEAIDCVALAVPSHENGTVEIELSAEIDKEILVSAIVDAGYEVN